MKKIHTQASKFHIAYTIILATIFLVVGLIARDVLLGVVMLFVVLYVAGNGIIHSKKSQLSRDALTEYILVAAIVIVVIIGVVL